MQNIIFINQEIKARDLLNDIHVEKHDLYSIAEYLVKKYDTLLQQYYSSNKTINDATFYYINTTGKIDILELNKPFPRQIGNNIDMIYWTLQREKLFHNMNSPAMSQAESQEKMVYDYLEKNELMKAINLAFTIQDQDTRDRAILKAHSEIKKFLAEKNKNQYE